MNYSRSRLSTFIILLLILGFFVAWYFAASGIKSSLILPTPIAVVSSLFNLLASGQLGQATGITLSEVGGGFVIGVGLGLVVGLLMGLYKMAHAIAGPYVNFFMSVPQSIFLPIFIFAFGLGFEQRVLFGATHAFFLMTINAYAGVRSVDSKMFKLTASIGCGSFKTFKDVIMPWALPTILNGLRLAVILDFVGVLLAEMYIPTAGLGSIIVYALDNLETTKMLAVASFASIISIAINELIIVAERRVSKWRIA